MSPTYNIITRKLRILLKILSWTDPDHYMFICLYYKKIINILKYTSSIHS